MVVGRYLAPRPDDEEFPPIGIFRRLVRELGLALVVAGIILLLFVGYQLLGTNLTEQHKQNHLKQEFDRAVAAQAATLPTTTVPATTVPTTTVPATTVPPTSVPSAATAAGSPTTSTPATSTPPTTAANQAAGASDNPTVGTTPKAVPTGAALDHLVIPAIGVDKYVVQGVGESDLMAGPGHYPQTVLPGQVGNAAIAGHRTTYGAPFFRLNALKSGDRIIITDTSDHQYTYRVKTLKVVAPTDVAVLDPTRTAELTLTTCNPRFSLTSRLVVVATLSVPKHHSAKGAVAAAPAPAPAPLPGQPLASATLGTGNSTARKPALIYGALVVVLWILTRVTVLHTRRWKRNLAYLVGVAACLVALWFTFENVVRLLPTNL